MVEGPSTLFQCRIGQNTVEKMAKEIVLIDRVLLNCLPDSFVPD